MLSAPFYYRADERTNEVLRSPDMANLQVTEEMDHVWPENPQQMYRIACELEGRKPWLTEG